MKPFLLLLLLLAVRPAFAQRHFQPGQRADLDSIQRLLRERLASRYKTMPNAWGRSTPYGQQYKLYGRDSLTGKPLTLLPPQAPGVYNLPVDGMPCIVPDTNGLALMPNGWPHPSVPFRPAQGIPNPMDGMAPPVKR